MILLKACTHAQVSTISKHPGKNFLPKMLTASWILSTSRNPTLTCSKESKSDTGIRDLEPQDANRQKTSANEAKAL